jgi:hypothetical protein
MGQSVQVWNNLINVLEEEGLFKPHRGDWFNVRSTSCGNSLIVRLMNTKPHLNEYEDLDDLTTHPVIEFERNIRRMIQVAEDRVNISIEATGIYIMNREFEVSFC